MVGTSRQEWVGHRARCGVWLGLLVICFVWALPLEAKSPLRFRHLGIDDGLSQSTVYSIVQDSVGFLWFATQDGLNRFDSHEFHVYRHNPSDSLSLTDNSVHCLLVDGGTIWVGTRGGGVDRFDPSHGTFRTTSIVDTEGRLQHDVTVWALARDRRGRVWAGTSAGLRLYHPGADRFEPPASPLHDVFDMRTEGVYALHADRGTLWIGTYEGLYRLPDGQDRCETIRIASNDRIGASVKALQMDRKGRLWIGCETRGLFRYDTATGELVHYEHRPGDENSLAANRLFSLALDSNGRLWVGTRRGLCLYHEASDDFSRYRAEPTNPYSLGYDEVRCVLEDRDGDLWVGTGGGGVSYTHPLLQAFRHYYHDPMNPNSLAGDMVFGVVTDGDGGIWVAMDGQGISRILPDGRVMHHRHRPGDPTSLPTDRIWDLHWGTDGLLWFGTFGHGVGAMDTATARVVRHIDNPRWEPGGISSRYVGSLGHDADEGLWLATLGVGLNYYHPDTGELRIYRAAVKDSTSLPHDLVRHVYWDRGGRMWVATDGGLALYLPDRDHFRVWRHDRNDPESLSSNQVRAVLVDRRGRVWVGTGRGGLNLMRPGGESWERVTRRDGLPNNSIYGLLEGRDGDIWMSTNEGIARLDPETFAVTAYDAADGIQANEFNREAYHTDSRGNLYFGGVGGLTVFHPDSLPASERSIPVILTRLDVLGREFATEKAIWLMREITLEHDHNFFSVEYAALDFVNPRRHRYSYRLEGLDPGWHEGGGRRYASYTNVPPGRYRFQVRTADREGRWQDVSSNLAITVVPPFWKTAWFRAMGVIVLVAVVVGGYWLRVSTLHRRSRMLERQVAERTSELSDALVKLERARDAEVETQRLKTANQLAATIAHEFNNPLAIIRGYCELIGKQVGSNGELEDNVSRIQRQTQRMHDLVNKLLSLRTLREIDYAAGLKILDIHSPQPPVVNREPTAPEEGEPGKVWRGSSGG